MSTTALSKTRMKVPEFLAWAEAQPRGRYELVDGEIVAMAPERVRHNLVKAAVARALEDAVKTANLPCMVFTDGVGIVINDETVREPDASVQDGVEPDLYAMLPEKRVLVHHQRNDRGTIDTRIARDGEIDLTPPGMTVSALAMLGPSSAGDAATHSNERG